MYACLPSPVTRTPLSFPEDSFLTFDNSDNGEVSISEVVTTSPFLTHCPATENMDCTAVDTYKNLGTNTASISADAYLHKRSVAYIYNR